MTNPPRSRSGEAGEPVRHRDSTRNRRKALHLADVICEELEFLLIENARRRVNIRYAYGKARKLKNRLGSGGT